MIVLARHGAALIGALVLSGCDSEPNDTTPPVFPTTHFALDDSNSNLLASDAEFARVVARAAAQYVAALPVGTKVSVRQFGEVNGANNLRYDRQITRKSHPAQSVARDVARIIDGHARSDKAQQRSTEIFYTLSHGAFDCEAGDTIILLSDGVPSGQVRSLSAVLNGTEPLPKLAQGSLSGCTVKIWGFARTAQGSLSSTQANNLRAAYEVAMDHAGAKFEAVSNP